MPKQWANKTGIKAGSSLYLHSQEDGTLLINPTNIASQPTKINVDVTGISGESLTRTIIAAYLSGYDIIQINSKRILAEQKKIIRQVCYKLMGPEIIEETSKSVVIQDLLNPQEISIKKGIKRMFLIANSMHIDAVKALKTKDLDLAIDVIQRDDEVDRLFLLISKQFKSVLRRGSLLGSSDISIDEYHDYRMAAAPLERIADHAQKIANITVEIEYTIPEKTFDIIEEASSTSRYIVENAVTSLFNSDVKLANEVINKVETHKDQLRNLNKVLLKIDSPLPAVALRSVVDSIDRTGEYGSNIAEVAINSSMNP